MAFLLCNSLSDTKTFIFIFLLLSLNGKTKGEKLGVCVCVCARAFVCVVEVKYNPFFSYLLLEKAQFPWHQDIVTAYNITVADVINARS